MLAVVDGVWPVLTAVNSGVAAVLARIFGFSVLKNRLDGKQHFGINSLELRKSVQIIMLLNARRRNLMRHNMWAAACLETVDKTLFRANKGFALDVVSA